MASGGLRTNAGRKPSLEPTKGNTLRLTERQRATLKKLGGFPYLRKHLDDMEILIKDEKNAAS